MKINFYDEIRQMITEEFNLSTSDIQEMIRKEINQVVKSMVNRAIQQMQEGKDLTLICEEAVKKEFRNNCFGVSLVVKEAIREVLFKQLKLVIKDD